MRQILVAVLFSIIVAGLASAQQQPSPWEAENPIRPLPEPPLGISKAWDHLEAAARPTPEKVRLGRWLFYDKRLSLDGTIACATCHRPENAFSEPTPVSTGIHGQKGNRKAPTVINLQWTIAPHFFWDGRAKSLEEQATGPVANPIEMGNTLDGMIQSVTKVQGYKKYFKEAFGSEQITVERVGHAIASYERTRMSGNSPYDRWDQNGDDKAVADIVKKGKELFDSERVACNQCHLNQNFTDSLFHNLGIGWDPATKKFADEGRYVVSKKEEDRGAFKTPGLRELTKRAPYMHDGSLKTLRDVMQHYNKGGNPNPQLSPKIKPLKLTDDEIDAIVKFLESLDGEGYQDQAPKTFPQ